MAATTVNPNFFTTASGKKVELKYDSANGNVTGLIDGAEIYKNGVFDTNILTPDEKNSFQTNTITTIRQAASGTGTIPAFVRDNSAYRDRGQTNGGQSAAANSGLNFTIPTPESIITNIIADIASPKINLSEYGTPADKMNKILGDLLKYPKDILENQQDTLKITQYTYYPPYGDIIAKGEQVKVNNPTPSITNIPIDIINSVTDFFNKDKYEYFFNGAQRKSALKKLISTVILPIPNNVSDANATNWGPDQMNALSMAAAGNMPLLVNAAAQGKLTDIAGSVLQELGPKYAIIGSLISALGPGSVQLQTLMKLGALGGLTNPMSITALQSAIAKIAGFEISPEQILSRGYGVVPNSNLELLFSGPSLRAFSFGYMMSPRSEEEARMCRKIIRFFKQGMAPKKKYNSGGYGGRSMLLATPNVFKLQYQTYDKTTKGTKPIAGLNKFKICALTNVQTSYAEGAWAAYEEGQPARMQINLTFKELEPVYESDYSETPAATYGKTSNDKPWEDQDPVKDNEIGY